MRDRTLRDWLVATVAVSIPVVVLVANFVGVERSSTATGDRADDCALLAADDAAEQSSCTGSCGGRDLVTMLVPNGSVVVPTSVVITTTGINSLIETLIVASRSCLRARRDCGSAQC